MESRANTRRAIGRWNHPKRHALVTGILGVSALFAFMCVCTVVGAEGLPEITITSEAGYISGTYELTVTVTGDVQSGEVYYGVDDDDPSVQMDYRTGGKYRAEIDVDALAEGPHTIYVKALNGTGQEAIASIQVDVDRNSPAVFVTSEGGLVSGDLLVTADVSDPYLNESAVYAVLDNDLEAHRDNVMTRVDDHFEFLMDTTEVPDGDHELRVFAFDLWGSSNKSFGVGIQVDNLAPVIEFRSEGGRQVGTYDLRVALIDRNLDGPNVMVTVGSDDPVGMTEEGEVWTWVVETSEHPNGDLVLRVDAVDTLGHASFATLTITVDNKAQLTIIDVDWSGSTVDEGDSLQAKVTVQNDGYLEAGEFKVSILEGDKVLASTKVPEPLAPGTSSIYTVNWEAEGSGKMTLSVEVDMEDVVDEYDEEDNTWPDAHEVTVEASTPGPGALMAVLGLTLVAFLVSGRRR